MYSNDPIVNCPYDPNHTMAQSKLLWHITGRCQKKKTDGHLYATCPNNPLHIFRKHLMDQHLRECADKGLENEDLGITQDDLAAAISRQFKNKNKEEEANKVNEKNTQIPGFDKTETNQEEKKKSKRVRNKNKNKPEEKISPEMAEWYEKSYGAHAQKLNPTTNVDDDEIDFAKEFEETEAAAQQSRERSRNVENSIYGNNETDSSMISSLSITVSSKNTTNTTRSEISDKNKFS